MLEIKPNCENCGKPLPNDSDEAMVCSFECTFCKDCVTTILFNVCPNCGGGLEKRPTRPMYLVGKYPVSQKEYLSPIDKEKFAEKLNTFKDIEPNRR